ncbi:MAG: putative sulfate exporter family transporter [Bacteroidota bacterium]
MERLRREYRGILLCTIIALIIYTLTHFIVPSKNELLFGFLLGILIGNFVKIPQTFQSGISFTGSKLLEVSIIFLAFSINFNHMAAIGWQSFTLIAIVVLLGLLLTIFLSRKIKCPGSTGLMIGFGTVICGSSAIAALAPTVTKNKEEVGISMAVVNLLGSVGMVILPFIIMKFDPTVSEAGKILGGSLHSVGNVAGAAYPLGNGIGETALTIKLARVALLSPALIFFNYLINKNNVEHWKDHFKLPWYLWSFIAITVLTSFIKIPEAFITTMDNLGKIVLLIAMCAIGLNVSLKFLYNSGKRGLTFGIIMFAVQILLVWVLLIVL